MTLKLLSEWGETFNALLLKSFMIHQAVPLYLGFLLCSSFCTSSVSTCSLCGRLRQHFFSTVVGDDDRYGAKEEKEVVYTDNTCSLPLRGVQEF